MVFCFRPLERTLRHATIWLARIGSDRDDSDFRPCGHCVRMNSKVQRWLLPLSLLALVAIGVTVFDRPWKGNATPRGSAVLPLIQRAHLVPARKLRTPENVAVQKPGLPDPAAEKVPAASAAGGPPAAANLAASASGSSN